MNVLMKNIATVMSEEFDRDTADIDCRLEELENELLRLANSKKDYDKIADEIHRLRATKQETLEHNAKRQSKRQRIVDMTAFLQDQNCEVMEYDDKL